MLEQGLFNIAKPEAMIGLHVMASLNTGVIGYKPGPLMAGSDAFSIKVTGTQTHGSRPWAGVDPIIAVGADHHRPADHRLAARSISRSCRPSSPSARSRAASASTSFPTRWK